MFTTRCALPFTGRLRHITLSWIICIVIIFLFIIHFRRPYVELTVHIPEYSYAYLAAWCILAVVSDTYYDVHLSRLDILALTIWGTPSTCDFY